jgi:hypothetical protein
VVPPKHQKQGGPARGLPTPPFSQPETHPTRKSSFRANRLSQLVKTFVVHHSVKRRPSWVSCMHVATPGRFLLPAKYTAATRRWSASLTGHPALQRWRCRPQSADPPTQRGGLLHVRSIRRWCRSNPRLCLRLYEPCRLAITRAAARCSPALACNETFRGCHGARFSDDAD